MMDLIQDFLDFSNIAPNNAHFRNDGIGKVGIAGFTLGFLCGLYFSLSVLSFVLFSYFSNFSILILVFQFSTYMFVLCSFHFLEFFVTAFKQPKTLSYNSFVINHSKSYTIAVFASWLEYFTESIIFKHQKFQMMLFIIGLLLVIIGQGIRSYGMLNCGESFSHIIMTKKEPNHKLIKHGIYSLLRHPSYCGWFYWSIGTQLILCNPICFVAYAIVSWLFFKSRIKYEENTLIIFYGAEYVDYIKSSHIGIPFISSQLPNQKK